MTKRGLIKAPFTLEIVLAKIKAAKNALTPASDWRDRDEFFRGRDAINALGAMLSKANRGDTHKRQQREGQK